MTDTPPRAPAERICGILDWLCRALGNHIPRPGRPGLPDALLVLIWNRLRSFARRIGRVAARIAAGVPPAKPRQRRPRPERPTKPPPDPSPFRLPCDRGWLIRLIGYEAAGCASQLRHLLAQPDAAPLLADPRMGRLLRPLCHILNVKLPPEVATPGPVTASVAPRPEIGDAPQAAASSAPPPPARPVPMRRSRSHPSACGPPPVPA